MAGKHLLLGFGTSGACFREMRTLGFPQAYAHLGEEFETGEVAMDRHDELARLYNVSMGSCNTFVFVPKCVRGLTLRLELLLCPAGFSLPVSNVQLLCGVSAGAARWARTSTCCGLRASCS